MLALYKRLNLTEEDFKLLLISEYNSGLSQHQIANKLNCHITSIEKSFSKYKILSRSPKEAAILNIKHVVLSEKNLEILEGWLLSDGSLSASDMSCRFTFGLKHKEPIERLVQELKILEFTPIWKSKQTNCYHIKSHSYRELLYLYNKWYSNRLKEVPKDFKLSPTKAYYWFIGDGYRAKYGINLSTEGFNDSSIDLLKNELTSIDVNTTILKNRRLRIRSSSVSTFYNYIGLCLDDVYLYKWRLGK